VSGGVLILLELLLVFGLIVGFGVRELRSLKRARQNRARQAADDDQADHD
jgi:hypothetical protein